MAHPASAPLEAHPAKGDSAHHPAGSRGRPGHRSGSRRIPGFVKFLVIVVVLGAGIGGTYAAVGREKFLRGVHQLKAQVVGEHEDDAPVAAPREVRPRAPWTGLVQLDPKEVAALGLKVTTVQAQTEPIKLEINGKTDYDLNTLTKIRPRFDNALVQAVHVSAGQRVKKGDLLLELTSYELAAAKNDCRTKYVQWDHDHKYLVSREPLVKDGRITQIVWTDTQNDEKKSRLDYLVARDKLATFGMPNDQIDKLLEGLSDDRKKALEADDNTQDIARMAVHSPIDGVVVERAVVPGNFYDMANILLTISPMTELWVIGNVFESDQDNVHLGQKWDIFFQFSRKKFEAQVESIANGVDPDTRTVQIRASIPNPDHNLKAGVLVRAVLQIKPGPNDTVIPRNAVMVVNGDYYAFVERASEGSDQHRFERRKLEIEKEDSDSVIVVEGLRAGERVASNGSDILMQMYEDQATVETGLPPK